MENKEMNPLDAFFKNGIEGKESEPPSASWAQMESLLDAQGQGDKKKKPVLWYWAAAAILPFLIFSIWFFGFNTTKTEMARINSETKKNIKAPDIISTEKFAGGIAGSEISDKQTVNLTKDKAFASTVRTKNHSYSKDSHTHQNHRVSDDKEEISVPKIENTVAVEMMKEMPAMLPVPIGQTEQIEKAVDPDYEIASIEFKSDKPSVKNQEEQFASIEWKLEPKRSLSEKITNIKTGQFKNLPTMGEAKESLFALLSPRR